MAQNEAATLAEQLRKTAAAAGSHVLEGAVPMGSTLTGPHFYLEVDAALELITSTRPRVLYLYESVLDLDDLLDDAREALGLEDD